MHTNGSPPHTLDRMLRGLRAHIRTRRLPRPDRLVVSTPSRSVHVEFATDDGPTRLGKLLLWAMTLDGVTATWLALPNQRLVVSLSGRGPGGTTVHLSASAGLDELYGEIRPGPLGLTAHLGKTFRLLVDVHDTVTVDELVRVVTRARCYAPSQRAVTA